MSGQGLDGNATNTGTGTQRYPVQDYANTGKNEGSVEFNNHKLSMGLSSSGHPAWVKTQNQNRMTVNGRPISSNKNSRLLNRATSASVR